MPAKPKFYATATIDGVEYTDTRTSARPYTHAAFHASSAYAVEQGGPRYFATFHASAALAEKSGKDVANGATLAVVEVSTTAPDAPAVEPAPVQTKTQEVETVEPEPTAWVSKSGAVHTRECRTVKAHRSGLQPLTPAEAWEQITGGAEHCSRCAKVEQHMKAAGLSTSQPTPAAPVEPESQNPVSQDVEAAPAAPAPKTNKASTRSVLRNLDTDYRDSFGVKSFRNGQVWEHLNRDRERFERDAIAYLGDKSNLRGSTLKSADWDEIHTYFYPETEQSPEPTPGVVEPSPAAVDFAVNGSTKGTATFGSDSELGGNLVQIVLTVAALVEDGCTGLRIDSGPLSGHEDALMAAAPALAALHRTQVSERVSAGLAAARADGRRAGRPKALDDTTRAALAARVDGGESIPEAAKALNISRATAYRALPKAK